MKITLSFSGCSYCPVIDLQGVIQPLELGKVGGGGEEHDGSRMIVACERHTQVCVLTGGMPRQMLNIYMYSLRLLLAQSGTN